MTKSILRTSGCLSCLNSNCLDFSQPVTLARTALARTAMERTTLAWALFVLVLGCRVALGENASDTDASHGRPPNILLITVDNLGYGDLHCYNAKSKIVTPHLDEFAKQGVRLTQFYTASSTCTVSRACLLTGRVAQRHGLLDQLPGVVGNYGVGLNHSEILIPQLLKQSSPPYATGCFGKWNIGFAPGSRPTDRGFDTFVGHASGNIDYFHHNYNDRHDLYEGTARDGLRELHREGEYSTDIFADAACDFIRDQSRSTHPWFCYLPFNSPHFPSQSNKQAGQNNEWQAPDWAFEALDMSPTEGDPAKRYRAVVFALDAAIGRVLKSLDEMEVAEQTFVFLMSDNGAFRLEREGLDVGSNEPLRAGGVTCWEGGIRVAALARWPGEIKSATTIDQPLWSPDLFVACAKLAGVELPTDVTYDGRDPLPVLTEDASSPHESLYFSYRTHAALRQGDWKIVREKPEQPWMLFHLASDIAETEDQAEKLPERTGQLAKEFLRWERKFENGNGDRSN